ncbi:MAG: hypothetical protein AAGA85_02200 [Bacteroidota bacterium]
MLQEEIKYFKEIQPELRERHPAGGFVVICKHKVLGVWNERHDALKEGIKAYGLQPFLVKGIQDDLSKVINYSRNLSFPNAVSDE